MWATTDLLRALDQLPVRRAEAAAVAAGAAHQQPLHRSVDIITRTAHYASLTMGDAGYDIDGLTCTMPGANHSRKARLAQQ